MDYFKHLNGFRRKRLTNPISANAICLYYILLEYNNELYFLEWFTVPNSILQGMTNLSLSALQRARNELIQKGYISYRKGMGNQAGSYHLQNLTAYFDQQSEQQSARQSEQQSARQMHNKVTTLNRQRQLLRQKQEDDDEEEKHDETRAYCIPEEYMEKLFGQLSEEEVDAIERMVRMYGEDNVIDMLDRMGKRKKYIDRPMLYLKSALCRESEEG